MQSNHLASYSLVVQAMPSNWKTKKLNALVDAFLLRAENEDERLLLSVSRGEVGWPSGARPNWPLEVQGVTRADTLKLNLY